MIICNIWYFLLFECVLNMSSIFKKKALSLHKTLSYYTYLFFLNLFRKNVLTNLLSDIFTNKFLIKKIYKKMNVISRNFRIR